jgi:hypothetical protein
MAQFQTGNPGGRGGNPHAARVLQFKRELHEATTAEKRKAMIEKLYEIAMGQCVVEKIAPDGAIVTHLLAPQGWAWELYWDRLLGKEPQGTYEAHADGTERPPGLDLAEATERLRRLGVPEHQLPALNRGADEPATDDAATGS